MAGAGSSRAEGSEDNPNGFRLTKLQVPRSEIIAGGPARDAIRAVDEPKFVSARRATWTRPDSPVIGVVIAGDARAYPVHVMEYHQVVNDTIGGRAIAVTYDPLTDAAIAYRRELTGRTLRFGVSGLIHRCNFLVFDRETEGLWAQMTGVALSGPDAGRRLERIRVRVEPMARWAARHPATKVMELPDRERIDYRYSNYTAYWISETIPFPVASTDPRYHPKEVVLGVQVDGVERAYIGSILTRYGGRVVDEVAGRKIRIEYLGEAGTFSYEAPEDVEITSAYWFAWRAFHPGTEIWRDVLPTKP